MSVDKRPTVLIVDDESINRVVLAEMLKDECRVVLAGDGLSALLRVAEEPDIDLILLDVSMPNMDGYEVLRQLREDAQTAAIGVIFITGYIDEKEEEYGLLLGAVDYVSKPVRPAILRARVRNHLKLAMQRRELEHLSRLDGLTGIANRRHFDAAFDRVRRRALRSGESLCLAMIDVDHFKLYNDHYGHGAGDKALQRVARVLAEITRQPHDLAGRYGGEEFGLLLSGPVELEDVLERVCQAVRALAIPHEMSSTAGVLTVSCGGVVVPCAHDESLETLLRHADLALYQSKRNGRNRVHVTRLDA